MRRNLSDQIYSYISLLNVKNSLYISRVDQTHGGPPVLGGKSHIPCGLLLYIAMDCLQRGGCRGNRQSKRHGFSTFFCPELCPYVNV